MGPILNAVAAMGSIGLVLSIILGIASKVFYVYVDPKVVAVDECLPGANCGGCGYAGCSECAVAIVAGDAPPNACKVGGDDVAEAIQYHHTTDLSLFPNAASAQLGGILMLADHLSREAAEENEDTDFQDPVWNNIEAEVLSDLGLDEDNMLDLRETALEFSQLT